MDQVAADSQLLDTAQDCLHFVTKFFEPINVSATHIYHSALELCPVSSIVRRLYYNKCHGVARFPRVVIGTPGSWDPTVSFSGKGVIESCSWSPCGRFVVAQMGQRVEIRNHLTFELLTVLRSAGDVSTYSRTTLLSCSPDGRFLACGFPNAILIWDIQTGGAAKEIECHWCKHSLVWSLDGRTIATTINYGDLIQGVETYDVASGTQLFARESDKGATYFLWADEKSFRLMMIAPCDSDVTNRISIFDIGPTLTKIESFGVTMGLKSPQYCKITFSPLTYRISTLYYGTLHVWDIRNSECLLEGRGYFSSPRFSSNGSLFAASHQGSIRVWKYTSGSYILCGESLLRHLPSSPRNNLSLQFSPTSSSILSCYGSVLEVRRWRDPHTTPQTRRQYAAISQDGNHIATVYGPKNTVAVIDLHSQTHSRFINTGMEIEGLAITGNVILVASSEKVVAWLLTEEGPEDRVFDNERTNCSGSVWTISSPLQRCKLWGFRVEGQIGIIETDDIHPFIYHTATGNALELVHEPRHFNHLWVSFCQLADCREYYHLRYHNTPRHNIPPEEDWLMSNVGIQEAGWIMGPEGRHRFWVPVEWRKPWERENWHHDITIFFTNIGDHLIVIKF